jgi:hypothetical protein
MKKNFTRLFLYLILFTIFGISSAPSASGQSGQIPVQPTPLYRFQVSYWDGGHLLTANYQEGLANGYTFDPFNSPTDNDLAIYVPPPGYTADPSSGLVPLHRWTVIQDGWRVHYYYSTYYSSTLGSDYYYNGVAGWVFTPGMTSLFRPAFLQPLPLHQLSVWYSTDLGFWNGDGIYPYPVEPPPNRSGKSPYYDQGVIAALPPCANPPPGGLGCAPYVVAFNPPPPPPSPSSCNVSQSMKNACAHHGGTWDDESCRCEY